MATITFGSNNPNVQGTTGNDSMIGNQTGGNFNDIVYGHQGNDTITFVNALSSNNTLYGGQGNDIVEGLAFGSRNIIYGNFGNDILTSTADAGDTFYGGQGNDLIATSFSNTGVVYGNLGDDFIAAASNFFDTYYGGQGNDVVEVGTAASSFSFNDIIYGNFGNDLLVGHQEVFNSHEYGGQGNDTLVFTASDSGAEVVNDTMTGNLGNDLFIATNTNGIIGGNPNNPFAINTDDIVTVTDFLSGTDQLAESRLPGIGLTRLSDIGGNASGALGTANNFYATHSGRDYVFVYGGTGAGYLFYNSDAARPFATTGMALVGNNQESGTGSIAATDITTIPNTVPFA